MKPHLHAMGTIHREVARADRIREEQKQDQKASRNAIANLRELAPYREELDSVSEVTVGIGERVKVGAKGIPPWALGFAIGILALAVAVVAILRALG